MATAKTLILVAQLTVPLEYITVALETAAVFDLMKILTMVDRYIPVIIIAIVSTLNVTPLRWLNQAFPWKIEPHIAAQYLHWLIDNCKSQRSSSSAAG